MENVKMTSYEKFELIVLAIIIYFSICKYLF